MHHNVYTNDILKHIAKTFINILRYLECIFTSYILEIYLIIMLIISCCLIILRFVVGKTKLDEHIHSLLRQSRMSGNLFKIDNSFSFSKWQIST